MSKRTLFNNDNTLPRALVFIALALLAFFTAGNALGAIKPGARYSEGAISFEAKNATLADLLQEIARTAAVDIFVTRGFQPGASRMTMKIDGEPLEDVLKSLLHGYNYAAVYVKEGDDFRIAALKIYPEGQQGGEVVPLFSGGAQSVFAERNRKGDTVAVLVNTTGNIVRKGEWKATGGILGPSTTEISPSADMSSGLREPWLAMQLQAEQDETERFSDLLLLKKRMESEGEIEKKQALTLSYADAAAKFEAFKRSNQSKIESLKRVGQFQAINGN